MRTIENLWREYLRSEFGASPPPEDQLLAQRRAFFTGAWSQWVFSRKMHDLDPDVAQAASNAIEVELASTVCASPPNHQRTSMKRLAA